jgi:hypothetical protein
LTFKKKNKKQIPKIYGANRHIPLVRLFSFHDTFYQNLPRHSYESERPGEKGKKKKKKSLLEEREEKNMHTERPKLV